MSAICPGRITMFSESTLLPYRHSVRGGCLFSHAQGAEPGVPVIHIKPLSFFEEIHRNVCERGCHRLVGGFKKPLGEHGLSQDLGRHDARETERDENQGIQALAHQHKFPPKYRQLIAAYYASFVAEQQEALEKDKDKPPGGGK